VIVQEALTETSMLWSEALRLFQGGDFSGSRRLCAAILEAEPDHPDALHLEGAACFEEGDPELGIEFFGRSVDVAPDRSALRLNFARALRVREGWAEAVSHLRRVVELEPRNLDGLQDLGQGLLETDDLDEAHEVLHRALAIRLDDGRTWLLLGKVLARRERLDEAILAYRAAVSVEGEPWDHTEAWFCLGAGLFEKGDFDHAAHAYERVLEQRPGSLETLHNLGDASLRRGNLDRAMECFRNVLRVDPNQIESLLGVSCTLMRKGELEESLRVSERAVALRPDHAHATFNLAIHLLLRGDYERGLELYEARRKEKKHATAAAEHEGHNEWRGESPAGKTIFVYREQGFGDVIQWVRYLPLLRDRGARVLFRPPAGLASLLGENDLGVEIVPEEGAIAEKYDLFVAIGTLPLRFGTTLDTIPSPGGYLTASREKIARYKERFFQAGDLKVGLVWQGSPKHQLDAIRSMSLVALDPLFEVPGIRIYSLQKAPGLEQLEALSEGIRPPDLGATFEDFSDTAAAVACLDLVITVDTAVAHLAGALGRPTWLLLPIVNDWRWLLGREDSPWYESIRIFRQKVAGDWSGVVRHVLAELDVFLKENARSRKAKP
jgi:tetratricopeptide (TPR) repeat protein